jgi:hypothetical protein
MTLPPSSAGAVLLGPSSFGESDPAPRTVLESAGFTLIDHPFRRKLTKEEVRAMFTRSTTSRYGM